MDIKDIKLMVQSTPNPNALKFVLNKPVKNEGKAIYKTASEAADNAIASQIFAIPYIAEVYFFDNYITVTQNGDADWDELEEKIKKIILDNITSHNPDFQGPQPLKTQFQPQSDNPEIAKIEVILNQTIRPALQMDGGDIQIVALEGNILQVNYQGACGSCPSSSMGTLKAIENLLRNEYNPDLVVEMASL
jgi:Fe-S cluster biogenesis protein NfuA